MARHYKVEALDTGFFTGNLKPEKMENHLNTRAAEGWRLVRTIRETRSSFGGLSKREAHFLIFEREA